MVNMNRVEGKKVADVKFYGLSTCVWCKKTKKLLDDLGAEYDFVFVDLCKGKEKEEVMGIVKKHNPGMGFPTVVIDGECIVGFDEEKIRKKLQK